MCGGRGEERRGQERGGRGKGGGRGGEAPVLSGAVCVCLSVCSHTVEINLPSELWNKERRKLARSDTLREKWRDTRLPLGGAGKFGPSAGGEWGGGLKDHNLPQNHLHLPHQTHRPHGQGDGSGNYLINLSLKRSYSVTGAVNKDINHVQHCLVML